jgi:2-polyprenyl-6-methoxyphenol hydroxylase-like FAD-dependent oxidoreductase
MSGARAGDASLRVIVIGAGIAGLCLAQGLRRAGTGVSVYERDASARFRSQGYRLTIKAEGSQALSACLPPLLFELCVATSLKQAARMVFLDHRLNQGFSKFLPLPTAPDDAGFGVNRLTLREILLAGLDEGVHFGKTFTAYEEIGDGTVCAHFADGTSVVGDLLVGADGTGSVVRQQLIPQARLDALHTILYGKTPLTVETLAWVPEVLVDSFNRISGPDNVALSLATCRTWESTPQAARRLAPTVALTNVPDYFAWTLSLPEEGGEKDSAALHRLALDAVRDWHPALRRLIAEADSPTIFPITISSAQPVEPWQVPSVTLLGDAIHTMSPGRGEGATTALRDAALLRRALVDVRTQGTPLAHAKAQYETEMLRYGFEAVDASLNAPFFRRDGS